MGVINVLPQAVINKIAAGEVIERPASVVKELVENSLDAQAASVTVEIEDGGKKLIRVIDDGFGMAPDDVALAFGSHATSKLKTGDDLSFIGTLGFRGEALSSVGAVAHARIISRLRGAVEGAEVEVDGGAPEPARAKGAPEGTTVEVADLFFNVPARRKFLKSSSTEFAHIVEFVSRIALANPAVAFKLIHNGRETLNVHASGGRRRRLGDLYGKELAGALLEVDSGGGPISVTGFAAPPAHCRSNAKMQLTFVNGRHVRDRSMTHAISSAYEGLLTRGRYPVAFVFVQIDPREVDVNVHPTKIEVRFHQGQMVYKTVLNAVREALHGADLTPVFEGPSVAPSAAPAWGERKTQSELPLSAGSGPLLDRPRPSGPPSGRAHKTPQSSPSEFAPAADRGAGAAAAEPAEAGPGGRVFFQVANAYICEERADGLAVIDQHALHERIIFNEIRERLEKAPLESQRMLIPAVVGLGKAEVALLLAERDTLASLGVELSEFGHDAIAVNALPVILGQCGAESVLHDFLAECGGDKKDTPVEAKRLAAAKMIACKAAVKAGDRLTHSEMRSLLEKAQDLEEGDTCPHGRPVCIFFPFADLERQFQRR